MSRLGAWTLRLKFAHYALAIVGVIIAFLVSLGWRAAKADDRFVPQVEYHEFRDEVIRRLGTIDGKLDILTDIERQAHHR